MASRPKLPASLAKITAALDAELRLSEVPDYPQALNGLQLANRTGTVSRVVAAVDACLPVVEQAITAGADLLVVHHGLFWSGAQRLQGRLFEKYRLAIEHNLAIYSAHIPLDVHPQLGNNAVLAKVAGLGKTEPFFPWKGIQLGLRARGSWSRETLREKIASAVGGPVLVCPGGPETCRNVGLITGGAGAEVAAAAAQGIDTFITGEGQHWTYTLAEELGVNLFYAGHYATETFGVRALAGWLQARFGVPHTFVDHPTQL